MCALYKMWFKHPYPSQVKRQLVPASTPEVIAITADTYLLPLPTTSWSHYELIIFLVFTQQDLCI